MTLIVSCPSVILPPNFPSNGVYTFLLWHHLNKGVDLESVLNKGRERCFDFQIIVLLGALTHLYLKEHLS